MKGALIFEGMLVAIAAAIVLLDWWARRKDRQHPRPSR
jgi:hypothetical protein